MQKARRELLVGAGAGLLLACTNGKTSRAAAPDETTGANGRVDVTPPEDLMREHGVLNRILLVYDHALAAKELPVDAVTSGASIVKEFIEAYHEELEEHHVFPWFEKANLLADLTKTLKTQHDRGRELTATILAAAPDAKRQSEAAGAMRMFVRMYRPHEAREDTVLFPAFRRVVSPTQFRELADQFEDEEHRRFGNDGFDGVVARVAKIEESLGIHDLNQFTPPKS